MILALFLACSDSMTASDIDAMSTPEVCYAVEYGRDDCGWAMHDQERIVSACEDLPDSKRDVYVCMLEATEVCDSDAKQACCYCGPDCIAC